MQFIVFELKMWWQYYILFFLTFIWFAFYNKRLSRGVKIIIPALWALVIIGFFGLIAASNMYEGAPAMLLLFPSYYGLLLLVVVSWVNILFFKKKSSSK